MLNTTDSLDALETLMEAREDEHLEFKEAKTQIDLRDLIEYCVALANEGGGKLILGVTNKKPRKVVGSSACRDLDRVKQSLMTELRLRIDVHIVDHPNGRVVIFDVPSRPIGMPLQYKGSYLMRSGEALVAMTGDQLKRIFAEAGPDFTAELCPASNLTDIDSTAVERFRMAWRRKSGIPSLENMSVGQLLSDAELMFDGQLTYAALILLGNRRALGRHLAQAEVIFEYRNSDASVAYQQRREFREGFFLFNDELWSLINLRNDIHHYQEGLFLWDIPTFNELVVREAILNAVSHRDYRLGGSTFVRQYPKRLEIVSPGGFPPGITPDNILFRQYPRNRRLAEAFARCGLVERSGQGANRMYEEAIKESKRRPDFSESDDYQVSLTLHGDIQDPRFLRFLQTIGTETINSFTTYDFLVLDLINRDQPLPPELKARIPELRARGIVEVQGRGRGVKYLLSRRFYSFVGQKGAYTRKRGLDRETNKALLLKHIQDNRREGSQFKELIEVLPAVKPGTIQRLIRELKEDGRIHSIGRTRAGRWYPGPTPSKITANADND
jgi:ATP-dependent DNA helicase RecG